MSSAHTSLRSTSARPDKGYKGLGMEGAVARWYAKNTGRNLAPFRDAAQRLHARLPRGAQVLEVAPGPGYLAIELAKLGNCQVTGLDISRSFVEIATHNATEAGVPVQFRQGDAAAMPLGDGLFDMVVCRAAFKNFSRPVEALNEMYRVLKPGGTALVIDLSKDATAADIKAEVDAMQLGALNSLITRLTFKHLLLKRAYRQEDFRRIAGESRFGSCQIDVESIALLVLLSKAAG